MQLPFSEKEKMLRFRQSQDAELFLLGRHLISNNILDGDISKLNLIQKTKFGKPYFDNYPFFNISHSGEVVILIKSVITEVGIDIEKKSSINLEDFKMILTTKEYTSVQNSDNPIDAFYTYWTQKEAIVKCVGHGLSLPLDSFEVSDNLTVLNNGENFATQKLVIDDAYSCHFSCNYEYSNSIVKIEKQIIN